MVLRAVRVPEDAAKGGSPNPAREMAADLLLYASMLAMTYFFWGLMYEDIDNIRGVGLAPRGVVFLVAASLLFVVFYLPQRFLFLVEDYYSCRTWVQVWAAMLPLAYLVLIG